MSTQDLLAQTATGPSQAPAYQVERVRFRYGLPSDTGSDGGRPWVVRDLEFDVRPGEVFGVIGPNGSGKTSLLKLLGRLLYPQEGRITLFGTDLPRLPQEALARTVALVPQESHQVFRFSIAEVVLMGRFPHHRRRWHFGGPGWETREDIAVAEEAMTTMDVIHLAQRPLSEVSGGERQRALIARALTQQPTVLLLDEPTAFLDLNHQVEICRILRRLNQEQTLTVVLVSHDLNLASQYCDRLMLLSEGTCYTTGSPEEVIRPEILETVYGCRVLVDQHPVSGLPRVTLPGRADVTRST